MSTRVILGGELKDGMTLIGFMDKTAVISRVRKGNRYVNFHNDTLGMNDRIGLYDEVTIMAPDTEPDQLVLVCRGCGEVFDDMTAAHEHGVFIPGPDPAWCGEAGFDLAPKEML